MPPAVGEFRALVDVAERDRALCDTLKRVLKLSKASYGSGFWPPKPIGITTTVKPVHCRDNVNISLYPCSLCEIQRNLTQHHALSALLQGWEAARDHARSAVETDNRLRRWLPSPALAQGPPAGLLYRCTLGNIDLTAPLGK
jgi:hypothetical protein